MDKTNIPFWNDVIKAYERVEQDESIVITVQRDGLRAEVFNKTQENGVGITIRHDSESEGAALVTKTVDASQVDNDSEDKKNPDG